MLALCFCAIRGGGQQIVPPAAGAPTGYPASRPGDDTHVGLMGSDDMPRGGGDPYAQMAGRAVADPYVQQMAARAATDPHVQQMAGQMAGHMANQYMAQNYPK